MELQKPHNIVEIHGVMDALRRGVEPIPPKQLAAVQQMTVEQRAAWLKDRKAKRKAAKLARRRNRGQR